MQHFTTPTLNTKGKTSLDCPVVHLERELMNNYLSQFFKDGCIALPAELHIRHFRKLYDCDAFVEFYLNEYPQGVSGAYNRRGELFQRAKKWDKMTQLKNR